MIMIIIISSSFFLVLHRLPPDCNEGDGINKVATIVQYIRPCVTEHRVQWRDDGGKPVFIDRT